MHFQATPSTNTTHSQNEHQKADFTSNFTNFAHVQIYFN